MARIVSPTKEVALTAAKLEAQIKDNADGKSGDAAVSENRRRKWDCFHIATAMCLKCSTVYTSDKQFLKRKKQLGISGLEFLPPIPQNLGLDLREADKKPSPNGQAKAGEAIQPPASDLSGNQGAHDSNPQESDVKLKPKRRAKSSGS